MTTNYESRTEKHQVFQERYEALDKTLTTLHEFIDDLRKDWYPREMRFWEQVLVSLHTLRQSLDVVFPLVVPVTQHMVQAMSLDELIDTLGIAITAYLPSCDLSDLRHLHERQGLLVLLRDLYQEGTAFVQKGNMLLANGALFV